MPFLYFLSAFGRRFDWFVKITPFIGNKIFSLTSSYFGDSFSKVLNNFNSYDSCNISKLLFGAHEKINDKKVGDFIKKGELIGYVGNSGTKYGALNNLLGAHLHWEIHFENENNKYYLGQNISKESILKLSNKLFEGEDYEKN